jgi:hypothetical protein
LILILWDSLRADAVEPFKGIFKEETWSSFKTIETFTAPVIAATMTGKTPEELGLPRDTSAFYSSIDPSKIDDTLFDHFDSHISVGRLIGNGPCQLPPSRRENFKILPPIKWNAVSNWDPDIMNYVGQKWSVATDTWWDLIYWHSFTTHGPFSIFTGMGPRECPEVVNTDRLMNRMTKEQLWDWYMKGVFNAVAALRAIDEISDGKETIICFADHGEALKDEYNGQEISGHFAGMKEIETLATVPIWINRKVDIPKDISHLTLKKFVINMYKKFEKNNKELQEIKQNKKNILLRKSYPKMNVKVGD